MIIEVQKGLDWFNWSSENQYHTSANITHYIILVLYIRHILYYSRLGTYFVITVSGFMIARSNKIIRIFVLC